MAAELPQRRGGIRKPTMVDMNERGVAPADFRVATEAVCLVLGAGTKVDKALMGSWSVDTILWQAAGSLQALDGINGGGSV